MPSIQAIYTADPSRRRLGVVLRSMLSGMARSPYIAYRLVRKEIKAGYAGSALGMWWDWIDPLVIGAVFYILMRNEVINIEGDLKVPYAIFIIYGMLLFQTFSDAVTRSLGVMRSSRNLVRQLRMPPEALILSVLFQVLFDSIFRILVMLAFSLILWNKAMATGTSAFSPVGFLWFVAAYPAIILLGLAIGVFCAPFHVIYNDVGRAIQIFLRPLRYLSFVIFPIPNVDQFPRSLVFVLNPVAVAIENLRSLATMGTLDSPLAFAAWTVGAGLLFLLGWFIFHLSIPVLADRV